MGGEKGRPAWGSRTLPWCPNPQATAPHAVLTVGRQTEGVATTDSSPRPSRPGPPHPECPHPVSPALAARPSQGLLTWPGPRPHLPQTLTLHTLNSIRVSRSPITPHLDSQHTVPVPHICTPGVVPDSRGPPTGAAFTHSIPMLFTPPHTHTRAHTLHRESLIQVPLSSSHISQSSKAPRLH